MKKLITSPFVMIALVAAGLLSACQKNSSLNTSGNSAAKTSTGTIASTSTGNIVVAVTANAVSADSVVLMNACTPGIKPPDTLAFSALPASVGTYLTANYAGYTKQKAFKILDRTGAIVGYVVVINYNGKPVGLRFDASGAFVEVLEQREPHDIDGPGWHKGGRFDNRDGMHLDTVAVSALPTAIKTYFATNYATDTLVHAVVTKDTSYIVFSVNKGMFATAFSSKLAFIKRVQLNPRPVKKHQAIAQSALPAAIATYLTKTYPGYAFDKAFAETTNGVIDRYVVLIDASGTRYGLVFDISGTFVKSIPVK